MATTPNLTSPQVCDTIWHGSKAEALSQEKENYYTNYIHTNIMQAPEYKSQIQELAKTAQVSEEVALKTIPFMHWNPKNREVSIVITLAGKYHPIALNGDLKKKVKALFSQSPKDHPTAQNDESSEAAKLVNDTFDQASATRRANQNLTLQQSLSLLQQGRLGPKAAPPAGGAPPAPPGGGAPLAPPGGGAPPAPPGGGAPLAPPAPPGGGAPLAPPAPPGGGAPLAPLAPPAPPAQLPAPVTTWRRWIRGPFFFRSTPTPTPSLAVTTQSQSAAAAPRPTRKIGNTPLRKRRHYPIPLKNKSQDALEDPDAPRATPSTQLLTPKEVHLQEQEQRNNDNFKLIAQRLLQQEQTNRQFTSIARVLTQKLIAWQSENNRLMEALRQQQEALEERLKTLQQNLQRLGQINEQSQKETNASNLIEMQAKQEQIEDLQRNLETISSKITEMSDDTQQREELQRIQQILDDVKSKYQDLEHRYQEIQGSNSRYSVPLLPQVPLPSNRRLFSSTNIALGTITGLVTLLATQLLTSAPRLYPT